MITIKEIAKLANVSSSTVSRVLNKGYVSEEVRSRVLKIIEETGYAPSEQAKSLRTKRTKVIGVILPRLSTETSSRMVNGINDALAKEGYQIILTNTNLKPEKEIEYIRLLRRRQVDGIILLATNVNEKLVTEIDNLNIPLVAMGQEIPGVSLVINDDYQAAKDMTSLLVNKGHEKVAFIGVTEEDRAVGFLRKKGYLDALKKHDIPVKDAWIAKASFDVESGYDAMKNMLAATSEVPTAVFAVTDRIAIGAMQYLKELDYAIPSDIALAGTGNSTLSKYITPALTTIDFMNEEAGVEAANLLLHQIKHPEKPFRKIKMKYRFIERDSV